MRARPPAGRAWLAATTLRPAPAHRLDADRCGGAGHLGSPVNRDRLIGSRAARS